MTPTNIRVLCAALGYTAVLTQNEKLENPAPRADAYAVFIEDFCRLSVPEAFAPANDDAPRGKLVVAERMADTIAGIMKTTGSCAPGDLKDHSFTQEEIDRHWAMAYALASVKLNIGDA